MNGSDIGSIMADSLTAGMQQGLEIAKPIFIAIVVVVIVKLVIVLIKNNKKGEK